MNNRSYMSLDEQYANGFSKTARALGYDPDTLLNLAHEGSTPRMQKSAGYGRLARLITKLSPKIKDPSKLNWFTKLFTNTRHSIVKSNPVTNDMLDSIRAAREGRAILNSAEGGVRQNLPAYSSNLNPTLRSVTRLSPLKVLLGAGAGGGAVAAATGGNKEKEESLIDTIRNMDPALKKKLAIALGVGAAGLTGLGVYTASKKD